MTRRFRFASHHVLPLFVAALAVSCRGIDVEGLRAYGGDASAISVAVMDTTVDSRAPNEQWTDVSPLRVGSGVHAIVKPVDDRAVIEGMVPVESEIRQAVLRLQSSSGACGTLAEFGDTEATWNCRVDSNLFNNSADCSGANDWFFFPRIPVGPGAPGVWLSPYEYEPLSGPTTCDDGVYELDVTEDVIAWLDGTVASHPGWLLRMEGASETLHSAEAIAFEDQPQLVIRTIPLDGDYVPPIPSPRRSMDPRSPTCGAPIATSSSRGISGQSMPATSIPTASLSFADVSSEGRPASSMRRSKDFRGFESLRSEGPSWAPPAPTTTGRSSCSFTAGGRFGFASREETGRSFFCPHSDTSTCPGDPSVSFPRSR